LTLDTRARSARKRKRRCDQARKMPTAVPRMRGAASTTPLVCTRSRLPGSPVSLERVNGTPPQAIPPWRGSRCSRIGHTVRPLRMASTVASR